MTPFFRFDAADPDRTHADLREAYLLLYGDVGDDEWELRVGVDQVFWGVVESRSLVDIVNQTDLVEHPNEKTKMGQPMAHFTWSGEWGALELFGLTWHRPRTFPGRHGRQRAELVVDHDLTLVRIRGRRVASRPGRPLQRQLRAARRRTQRIRRHEPRAPPFCQG